MTARRLGVDRGWGQALRLGPAVVVVGGLSAYAAAIVVRQSLGLGLGFGSGVGPGGGAGGDAGGASLEAYRRLVEADGFWRSIGFTLWVASVGTALAVLGAVAILWHWTSRPGRARRFDLWILQLNLSIPHVVWTVALLATFSQSGWASRIVAAVGLIESPGEFPVLVRDSFGVGIIGHLVTKELPFLVLVGAPLAGRRLVPLAQTAATLGAGPLATLRRVFVPAMAPVLVPAALVAFAFAVGAYEPASALGVSDPRTLSVVALDRYRDPDLGVRADAQAISVALAFVVAVVAVIVWSLTRRWFPRRATS
jgi:putative spermidine/putrescine transport system permease protein